MNERGIALTRFEDIAKEANVTRGAIYHYFKGKNEILFAIHNDMKKQVMELFKRHISEKVDPFVSLKNGLKEILTTFENDVKYRAIEELFMKAEFTSLLRQNKDLYSLFKKEREETISDILELVKSGQEFGSIRKDIVANNIVFSIMAFYVGFVTVSFVGSGKFAGEGLIDDYIDVLLNGILKK